MKSQLKIGAVVSYVNIVLNMCISIFLTPFLISGLGKSEYGVYRIIQSFAGQLSIMSFGISTLIVRYLVYYETKKEQVEKENFLFFAKLLTYILALLMLLVGGVMFSLIEPMYGASLTEGEIALAKWLMIFLVANMALGIICDSYTGIVTAHERFVVSHGSKTLKLVLRAGLIVLLVKAGVGAIGVVVADCIVSCVVLAFVVIYGKIKLKEKAKFHRYDKALFKECFIFSVAILMQTFINQVNQNLDNVILGVMTSSECVAIYSVALTIFTTFNTLVTSLGGLYGPQATKLVAMNASSEELTDFVIKPGRIQFMIAGLAICGFALFGKNFIMLWVGEEYLPVYSITLLLLIPSVIPLVETTTESLLNAMLKRFGRSLILLIMCVVNIIVSVVCIKLTDYRGAAIGTAISFIFGYGILINLYLYKIAKLNIVRIFKTVIVKILPGIVISFAVGIPISFLPDTFVGFLIKVVAFTVIYSTVIYKVAMNEYEKGLVKGILCSIPGIKCIGGRR